MRDPSVHPILALEHSEGGGRHDSVSREYLDLDQRGEIGEGRNVVLVVVADDELIERPDTASNEFGAWLPTCGGVVAAVDQYMLAVAGGN
jgi:hypothetical protein